MTEIKRGPEKTDLMAALFEGKTVMFIIDLSGGVFLGTRVTVESAQALDTSRQNWNIAGYTDRGNPFLANYRIQEKGGFFAEEE